MSLQKWLYFKILEDVCFYLLLLAKLQQQRPSSAQLCSWTDLLVHAPQTSAGHCSSQKCRKTTWMLLLNVPKTSSDRCTAQQEINLLLQKQIPWMFRQLVSAGILQNLPILYPHIENCFISIGSTWTPLYLLLYSTTSRLHLLILAPFPLRFPPGNKRTQDCPWS